MHRNISVVVTTIFDGAFLPGYRAAGDAPIIVIPDRKSPAALYERCRNYNALCPSIGEQDEFLAKLGFDPKLIPYDSDNRRNVGFLMALRDGAGVVAALDDDNYCDDPQVFDQFALAGSEVTGSEVHSSTGWFNVCELLDLPPVVFPRGFPYRERHRPAVVERRQATARVGINAGLWLGEPDVDAMTRLVCPAEVVTARRDSVLLSRDTFTPVNSQNTAVIRELIPCYYYWRMGVPLAGFPLDRFGDIFSGYWVQACSKALGWSVRAGTPYSRHVRNTHNLFRDAAHEIAGVLLIDDFCQWLIGARPRGSTAPEVCLDLAGLLDEQVERFHGFQWTAEARAWFREMTAMIRLWVKVCGSLL